MSKGIGELFTQLGSLFRNLTPGRRVGLLVLAAGTIAAFAFVILWTGNLDFQVLYSNLSPEDAGAIVAKLKEKKIPYRLTANGNSILIPDQNLYETRLEMASQGLPRGSGVGFEIFDGKTLGMTEFLQNVNYQRALQGELARTINDLNEVESSRVHVVMPAKSLFVEEEQPVTASVVLKLRPGKWLSKEQIQGIVHLVSSSVSGLQPEKVTIVDNYGKMLAGFKENSDFKDFTSTQLDFQKKVEDDLENRVKTMLETALGPDKAIVRVSCALDFKKCEKTEEKYDPSNQVVRSEQRLNENSNGGTPIAMGVPGVTSNVSGGATVSSTTNTTAGYQKEDKTVNYEIGKVTSRTIEPIGKVQRVSVAVLVDGTYQHTTGEEGEEQAKYTPRSQEEMDKLGNLVKRAVNFDPQRGDEVEVVNIPFEPGNSAIKNDKDTGESPVWSSYGHYVKPVIRYGFMALFVVLAFLFVVRPIVEWLTSATHLHPEIVAQLPKTVEEIEREYMGGGKSLPYRERALDAITKDQDLSLQLLKDWLKNK